MAMMMTAERMIFHILFVSCAVPLGLPRYSPLSLRRFKFLPGTPWPPRSRPRARLIDWLHERTAGCPQKNPAGPTRACGAVMPDLVDLPWGHAARYQRRTAMSGKTGFVVLAVTIALSFLGDASTVAKDDMGDKGDKDERAGSVLPCRLSGVNPAAHPEIFGNPAVAASYGFVRSRDGTWHVRPGCHR
jgi:hypothetical protein